MDDSFNQLTKTRFAAIRAKMKLESQKQIIDENIEIYQNRSGVVVDKEKIQEMLDTPTELLSRIGEGVTEAAIEVDEKLDFIESLNLEPELSIAIGYIMASGKTKNNKELIGAIACLEKQIQLWKN